MIYFITYESLPGYVKIGYSTDKNTLEKRLATYTTYNPEPLKVLRIEEGDYEREQALHKWWENYRAPKGEWFYFASPIQDYVNGKVFEANEESTRAIPKYLHQKREGNAYTFIRNIPRRLQKFSKSASSICSLGSSNTTWWERLNYDYDLALQKHQKLVRDTDIWIKKHNNLIDSVS